MILGASIVHTLVHTWYTPIKKIRMERLPAPSVACFPTLLRSPLYTPHVTGEGLILPSFSFSLAHGSILLTLVKKQMSPSHGDE